jgi:hypothetical protein
VARKQALPLVLAVYFRAVGKRQPQLPDSFIAGAHCFGAIAAKVVRRLAHVSARGFQCSMALAMRG